MKYLITESRLDKMIDKYITSIIGGELTNHGGDRWYKPNGELLFLMEDTNDGLVLGVRGDLWVDVSRLFSLNDGYKTDKAFKTWMENYSGEKFPGGVFTF